MFKRSFGVPIIRFFCGTRHPRYCFQTTPQCCSVVDNDDDDVYAERRIYSDGRWDPIRGLSQLKTDPQMQCSAHISWILVSGVCFSNFRCPEQYRRGGAKELGCMISFGNERNLDKYSVLDQSSLIFDIKRIPYLLSNQYTMIILGHSLSTFSCTNKIEYTLSWLDYDPSPPHKTGWISNMLNYSKRSLCTEARVAQLQQENVSLRIYLPSYTIPRRDSSSFCNTFERRHITSIGFAEHPPPLLPSISY